MPTGKFDYDNHDFCNTWHTCTCCQKNKVPFKIYLGSVLSSKNAAFLGNMGKQSNIVSFTKVTQKMKDLTDDILTENLMILPKMLEHFPMATPEASHCPNYGQTQLL